MASVLPQLIDSLTPNGRIDDAGAMPGADALQALLKGRLFG